MKPRNKRNGAGHGGSNFDSFLEQEGIREEVEALAIKRVLAWQLEQAVRNRKTRFRNGTNTVPGICDHEKIKQVQSVPVS